MPKLLLAAWVFIFVLALHPKRQPIPTSGNEIFAFWYDTWQPDGTIKKLRPANVIIGAPSSAIPEIHKSGRRVLEYITYYQSRFKTAFLTDRNDLANVGFQRSGEFETSAFGGENNYVLCPNSVELRTRVLRYLDGTLRQDFDGYFIDNAYLDPAAHQVCEATHDHVNSGLSGGAAYVQLIAAVRQKLKAAKPEALLIINPGDPASLSAIAPEAAVLWDLSDYVLWESYGYTSVRGAGHDNWKRSIDLAYKLNQSQASKIIALSYPLTLGEARFSFAVARILGFRWTANLGEEDQHNDKEGGHFGSSLTDIPFALGEPLGAPPIKGSALLHRTFSNGEVFANLGNVPERISLSGSGTLFLGDAPGLVSRNRELALAPMTAAILLQRHGRME